MRGTRLLTYLGLMEPTRLYVVHPQDITNGGTPDAKNLTSKTESLGYFITELRSSLTENFQHPNQTFRLEKSLQNQVLCSLYRAFCLQNWLAAS